MKLVWTSAVLLPLTACGPAVGDAQLLVPDDVDVHWDLAFNGVDDGLIAVVPVDVMVFDSESAEPVAAVEIELSAFSEGVGLLPSETVTTVDGDCIECDPLWDAHRDRYVVLEEEPVSVLRQVSDSDGLARMNVVVDALDFDESAAPFGPLSVTASADEVDVTFYLVPR